MKKLTKKALKEFHQKIINSGKTILSSWKELLHDENGFMPVFTGFWQPPITSYVKSVQTVTASLLFTSQSYTIKSVYVAHTMILVQGYNGASSSNTNWGDSCLRVTLTNSTTLTFTTGQVTTPVTIIPSMTVVVVEFWGSAVNSIQNGSISWANTTYQGTATITAPSANAFVTLLGCTTATTGMYFENISVSVELTATTTVTAANAGPWTPNPTPAMTVGFQVVDLKSSVIKSIQVAVVNTTGPSGPSSISNFAMSNINTNNAMTIWNGQQVYGSIPTDVGYDSETNPAQPCDGMGMVCLQAAFGNSGDLAGSGNTFQWVGNISGGDAYCVVAVTIVEFQSGVMASNVLRFTELTNELLSSNVYIIAQQNDINTTVLYRQKLKTFVNFCGVVPFITDASSLNSLAYGYLTPGTGQFYTGLSAQMASSNEQGAILYGCEIVEFL